MDTGTHQGRWNVRACAHATLREGRVRDMALLENPALHAHLGRVMLSRVRPGPPETIAVSRCPAEASYGQGALI